jgi:hypothetical protein
MTSHLNAWLTMVAFRELKVEMLIVGNGIKFKGISYGLNSKVTGEVRYWT